VSFASRYWLSPATASRAPDWSRSSAAPWGPAGSTTYSTSGPTASAAFVGRVHGVVVQASALTPVSPSASAFEPTSGKVTVTDWSWRIWYTSSSMRSSWFDSGVSSRQQYGSTR